MLGLTVWVPPMGCRVYELPSLPVTVTCVAFVAVMVRTEELPVVIDVGFAAIVTAGFAAILLPLKSAQPEPARQINVPPLATMSLEIILKMRSVCKALSSNPGFPQMRQAKILRSGSRKGRGDRAKPSA